MVVSECVVCGAADSGLIAGAVIGAFACAALILAVMYYVFRVKGVRPGNIGFFKQDIKPVDVVSFIHFDLTPCCGQHDICKLDLNERKELIMFDDLFCIFTIC